MKLFIPVEVFVKIGFLLFATIRVNADPEYPIQNARPVKGFHAFRTIEIVPEYASRPVPRGGKTKFYGESRVGTGKAASSVLRIHLYEWSLDGQSTDRKNGRCAIDFYLKRSSRDSFHLVSTIKDDVDGMSNGLNRCFDVPVSFVNWMWLNNKTKNVPIVRICCHTYNGFYGAYGQNCFLTFSKGMLEKPTTQVFENHDSHIDFIDWFFDGQDAHGNRQLVEMVQMMGGGGVVGYSYWNWNERKARFEAQPETKTY